MAKRVVIIGAGLAGLSAGCYARLNGYEVEIHEAHHVPGGLCTGWRRQGYTFDGCVHWLTGSRPGSALYDIWTELGAMQGAAMYDHEIFASYQALDGRELHWYADPDRLEEHLLALAPQDAAPIRTLCAQIRRLGKLEIPVGKPAELMNMVDGMRMLAKYMPLLKDMTELQDLTLGAYAARFSEPLLRQALANALFEPETPAMALIASLGTLAARSGGFPLGGSLQWAGRIAARYEQLGGKISYGSRVDKIIVRNGRAQGVRLASGGEVLADWVISACDLRQTLHTFLDGQHVDPVHAELLASGRTYPPSVLTSFGVDLDLSDEISCLGTVYELPQPRVFGGRELSVFQLHNLSHDPSLAPAGKAVAQCLLPGDWAYWDGLRATPDAYDEAKDEYRADCLAQIERLKPGFGAHVEVADVATPSTFERYTSNWHGVYMTWQLDSAFSRRHRYIPRTVPGLDGFYTASMWTNAPGGLPSAVIAGRDAVQLLCHEDKKRFGGGGR